METQDIYRWGSSRAVELTKGVEKMCLAWDDVYGHDLYRVVEFIRATDNFS